MAEVPEVPDRADEDSPAPSRSNEIAIRAEASPVVSPWRRSRPVEVMRARLPELVRHPAVVAAATVGASVLLHAACDVVRARTSRRGDRVDRVAVTGYVIHRVHVHVVESVGPAGVVRAARRGSDIGL